MTIHLFFYTYVITTFDCKSWCCFITVLHTTNLQKRVLKMDLGFFFLFSFLNFNFSITVLHITRHPLYKRKLNLWMHQRGPIWRILEHYPKGHFMLCIFTHTHTHTHTNKVSIYVLHLPTLRVASIYKVSLKWKSLVEFFCEEKCFLL